MLLASFCTKSDLPVNVPTENSCCLSKKLTYHIAGVGDHYAVQGHSASLMLISIESPWLSIVPKSVTLNDLERRDGRYFALLQ